MEFDKDNLNEYSIFFLRNIARDIGVKCPTSLTKEKLIKEIIKVQNGNVKPIFSKRGKPPLKHEGQYSFIDKETRNRQKDKIATIKRIKRLCKMLEEEIDKL